MGAVTRINGFSLRVLDAVLVAFGGRASLFARHTARGMSRRGEMCFVVVCHFPHSGYGTWVNERWRRFSITLNADAFRVQLGHRRRPLVVRCQPGDFTVCATATEPRLCGSVTLGEGEVCLVRVVPAEGASELSGEMTLHVVRHGRDDADPTRAVYVRADGAR